MGKRKTVPPYGRKKTTILSVRRANDQDRVFPRQHPDDISVCPGNTLVVWQVTLLTHHLQRHGMLNTIEEQVRFARRRFGRYEVIDFVAVLFGYSVSGERRLEAFYICLQHWAGAFMALFGRDRLPTRATLSRFLTALDKDRASGSSQGSDAS